MFEKELDDWTLVEEVELCVLKDEDEFGLCTVELELALWSLEDVLDVGMLKDGLLELWKLNDELGV
jgi:hypothetical protein